MAEFLLSQGAVSNPPKSQLTGTELLFGSQETPEGWVTIVFQLLDLYTLFATTQQLEAVRATLQSAINGKANLSHTHAIGEVTGLATALDGKAATSHTHAIAAITGLADALAGKAAINHTHTMDQISGLVNALAAKANLSGADFTGTVKAPNLIAGGVGNGAYVQIGDDVLLSDIGEANTFGVVGLQNNTVGRIRLGVAGAVLECNNSSILTVYGQLKPTGGYDFGSSRKLKNIEGDVAYTLDDLDQIPVVMGRYKPEYHDDGLLRIFYDADGLAGIIPEAVNPEGTEFQGEMVATIKIDQLLPLNTHFIKLLSRREREHYEELQQRVEDMDRRLAALEGSR